MRSARAKFIGIISLTLAAVLLTGAGIAYANRQHIQDLVAASQYTPTNDMQAVMDRVAFTGSADTIFRASNPTLDATQGFNRQCAKVIHRESDQVVGCFTGSTIHLFQISDQRLDGMVEVTAAHEMLHAAFARLSPAERATLSADLRREYARLSATNPKLAERMSVYADLDDAAFANELHSVLGTEVANLTPRLESHYAKYFSSRKRVLALFDKYHSYFNELDAQRSELRDQLELLAPEINTRADAYESALATYNADAGRFTARNQRYEFAGDTGQFYAIRDELNTRRERLESERVALNEQIAHYNELREQLLALDATAQELVDSISSQLAPPAVS
jgi:hypothetical protein